MSPLDIVLFKKASDEAWMRPFDPTQQGMIVGGTGALLGAGIGGLGGLAFGRKGRRLSSGLKGALLGGLGGGALGGYLGYSGTNAKRDAYWNEIQGALGADPKDPTGYLPNLRDQNDSVRQLYEGAQRRGWDTPKEQFDRIRNDTPTNRLGGWLPNTTTTPKQDAAIMASRAFRDRTRNAMRDISITPGEYTAYMQAGGPKQFGYGAMYGDQLEGGLAPDLQWLQGQGAPTPALMDSLVREYR